MSTSTDEPDAPSRQTTYPLAGCAILSCTHSAAATASGTGSSSISSSSHSRGSHAAMAWRGPRAGLSLQLCLSASAWLADWPLRAAALHCVTAVRTSGVTGQICSQ